MTMQKYHISSRDDLAKAYIKAKEMLDQAGSLQLVFSDKNLKAQELQMRTKSQNNMKEMQVHEIAKQLYGGDEQHARRECKLMVGLPILMRDNEIYRAFADRMRTLNIDHAEKLEMMDLIQVTSVMSTVEKKEYLDNVFDYYAQQGVVWDMLRS